MSTTATAIKYQSHEEPQYDIEDVIGKFLDDVGPDLPKVHNAFLCRDGDFYVDFNVPHHDDIVREIGTLAGMEFTENQDVSTNDIHEFMFRTGIIRGHRFSEVPQYDFDIVFPPTSEQVQTMINIAAKNPEVDIGFSVGFEESTRIYGRGINALMFAIREKFLPKMRQEISNTNPNVNIEAEVKNIQATIVTDSDEPLTIQSFREGEGLFIRSFFADSMFNQNKWRITQDALNRDIATGIEKTYNGRTAPIIDTPDDSHPPDETPDMIEEQEQYRKGDFLRIGIDEKTHKAYVDAVIYDKITIEKIQNGELNYVSPSIQPLEAVHELDGSLTVTRFRINHLALVKNPAYGTSKAQIKGRCTGTEGTCLPVLENIQASVMPCGGLDLHINTKLVKDEIRNKIKQGKHLSASDIMEMVSDTMEPPQPCHKCGQPYIDHNASSDHEYIPKERKYETLEGEDSEEQINQREQDFMRKSENIILVGLTGQVSEIIKREHELIDSGIPETKVHDILKEEFASYQAADECVQKWIPELKDKHPTWKQDQVLAVAYSKCKRGEHMGAQHSLKLIEQKEAEIKALKANLETKDSMSSTQQNKISDEDERRRKLEQDQQAAKLQAEKDEKDEEEKKEMKDKIASLEATLNSEIKAPIVEKIVQARIKAGTLQAKEKESVSADLMKHDISYLKNLDADFTAMQKTAEAIKPATVTPRFNYQASTEDEKVGKTAMAHIRERCSN